MLFLIIAQPGSATTILVLIFAVAIAALSMISWLYWKRKRVSRFFDGIPSPPGHWLFGNLPQVLTAVKQKTFFRLLFDWSQQYGSIYTYWIGSPVLMLSKPSTIETTIINGMRDGSLIRSVRTNQAWNDISGPILLGQTGTEWQWRRKVWNPEFSSSGLSQYLPFVDQACALITDKIKTQAAIETVYVDALFVELTLRVISCLLLGIPVNSKGESPEGPPLDVPKIYQSMAVIGYRFLRVATGEKLWKKYLPTKTSREYWAARHYLEDFLAHRVDLALRLQDHQSIDPDSISPLFQASMLVKIAAKEPLYTRETLISESIELLIAGTDTTAHTLSFTVGELALHPEIFQKAQAIADRVWEQHGTLCVDSLKDLSYIRAIVKETLRLYSVASGSTSLEATRETVVAGITIPAGTKVFWSILGAGRDAETYPEPDRFWPERWLDEEKGSPSLPMIDFGSGSHRCLGEHLAMLEATLMIAQLLRTFNWELVNGEASLRNLEQNLLIYPADGMPVKFYIREHAPAVA